jgi:hypothetical protein
MVPALVSNTPPYLDFLKCTALSFLQSKVFLQTYNFHLVYCKMEIKILNEERKKHSFKLCVSELCDGIL